MKIVRSLFDKNWRTIRRVFWKPAPEQLTRWRYYLEATFCLIISPVFWPFYLYTIATYLILFSIGAVLVGWYPTRNFFQSCLVWTREDDCSNVDFVRYTRFPPIIFVIVSWIAYSLSEFIKVSSQEGVVTTFYQNTFVSGFKSMPNATVSLPTQLLLVIPSVILVSIGYAMVAGILIGIMHCAFLLDDRYRIFAPLNWCHNRVENFIFWIFDRIEDLYHRYRVKNETQNDH